MTGLEKLVEWLENGLKTPSVKRDWDTEIIILAKARAYLEGLDDKGGR